MKFYINIFEKIASLDNLFSAWDGFKKGKRKKKDVMAFEFNLEDNIIQLHRELKNKTYKPDPYSAFYLQDPKQRIIHKATVRDRILHHAVFSILNPIFEPTFIDNSFSCRIGKGTHKGVNALRSSLRRASKNGTKDCYILKCDIRKFFHSVDHDILISIFAKKIKDDDAIGLVRQIVESFPSGVPIGNLTSQLFANVYMNEFDQYIKHKIKAPFYLRYTDDFLLIDSSLDRLNLWLENIKNFLSHNLKLNLHPNKVVFRKYHQGVDFLGYVQLPEYRALRTRTKRRIFKKIVPGSSEQSLQSYLGVISHCNGHRLSEKLLNQFWFGHEDQSQK